MNDRPAELYDRESEWRHLRSLYESEGDELLFVLGRRRIGKTHLLRGFCGATGGLYYQASRQNEQDQLRLLTELIGEHFEDLTLQSGASFPNWTALFDYIFRRSKKRPFLLVIDEFTYLTDASPSVTSQLQRAWDGRPDGTCLKLVLCGSYVSAMRGLEASDQPLHGRRTGRMELAPFPFRAVKEFVPDWSFRERARLVATIGRLPGHLTLVNADRRLAWNIQKLLLDPNGRLVDEAQFTLDAFVPNSDTHYALLDAIANGDRTWSGFAGRLELSGGSLTRPLEWLIGMGIVDRVVPITEKNPSRSKRAIYRVADPYLAFWHREIAPLVRRGSIGLAEPDQLWKILRPRIENHMGHVFEEICREWVRESKEPFAPVQLGSWWDHRSQNEVDLVALSADRDLLCGECKWGTPTLSDLKKLRTRASMVATEFGAIRSQRLVLFSGRGDFGETLRKEASETGVILVGPTQLNL